MSIYFYFIILFFGLFFELRASHLQSKYSMACGLSHTASPFCSGYFTNGVS
jgi:hypothetical protein